VKITLTTTSPASVIVLGDDNSREWIPDYDPAGQSIVQPRGAIRAARKNFFARGNAEVTVRWLVARSFCSTAIGGLGGGKAGAIAFLSDSIQNLLNLEGTLRIFESTTLGAATRVLPNAVFWSIRRIKLEGVELVMEYIATGGNFTQQH